jgi:hypothetical protein
VHVAPESGAAAVDVLRDYAFVADGERGAGRRRPEMSSGSVRASVTARYSSGRRRASGQVPMLFSFDLGDKPRAVQNEVA